MALLLRGRAFRFRGDGARRAATRRECNAEPEQRGARHGELCQRACRAE